MQGRVILTASAVLLFLAGSAAMFGADEISNLLGPGPSPASSVLVQLVASGLLGFAILNWMSRGQRIGGIYGRPVAIANLLQFVTAALSIGKAIARGQLPMGATLGFVLASALAFSFAWLAFIHDPVGRID